MRLSVACIVHLYDQVHGACRFEIINGLLLPGGGAELSPGHMFYDTAQKLVSMAIKANENGDYFPVSSPSTRHVFAE